MTAAEDSAQLPSKLWSKKKIALIILGPPAALILAVLIYLLTSDEKLQPFPELATTPQPMPGPEVNGFAFLLTKWKVGPDVDYKIRQQWRDFEIGAGPWQDIFPNIFNPKGQNFTAELDEALSRPAWQDPGPTVLGRERAGLPSHWDHNALRALKAEAWRQCLAADLKPAVSVIGKVRQMARRQIQGCSDIPALSYALQWTHSFGEFTCNVVESFHPSDELLSQLTEAYAEDPITPADLAASVRGSSALFAKSFEDEDQMDEIHWLARQFLLKRNKTLNLHNRELAKLLHGGLETKPAGASYGYDYFSAPEWQRGPATFNNLVGIWMARNALRSEGGYLSDFAREQLFQTRALRVWLAIRRWELRHPAEKLKTLTDLPEDLLTAIPQDPWTGQPLTWDPSTERIEAVGADWKPGPALFRACVWLDLGWETASLRLHRPPPPPKAAASAATRP